MKKLKLIDLWGSITLFIVLSVWCVLGGFGHLIVSYLILGGWQLTSMIVHAYKGWFNAAKTQGAFITGSRG